MHFTWDLSFGNLLAAGSVICVGLAYHRDWVNMITQHKMMWLEYCKRHRIIYAALPKDTEGD